ncbi:MAG: glycosyltransferase family 4 protein [Armatimonadetes bacterium]|nr:glycosyltransferase family 4 protein [Armatimonadota bacterium]
MKVKNTTQTQKSKFLKNLGINKPYLLYVGSAYPHKNLERLLKAFERLAVEYFLDYQLVLVGKKDYFYKKLEEKVASNRFLVDRVVLIGYISDKELDILYQNAFLYIFPSLAEGFGLPPLEAMSHGLPVVSSNTTCLPEILGDAAEYFNPEDIDNMVEKVIEVLKSNKLRRKLGKLGRKRINNFNWARTAKQTQKIYKSLVF